MTMSKRDRFNQIRARRIAEHAVRVQQDEAVLKALDDLGDGVKLQTFSAKMVKEGDDYVIEARITLVINGKPAKLTGYGPTTKEALLEGLRHRLSVQLALDESDVPF